jgi:hypothetical protein
LYICVCVKQTPDSASVYVDPITGQVDYERFVQVLNQADACAVEAAVRLKEALHSRGDPRGRPGIVAIVYGRGDPRARPGIISMAVWYAINGRPGIIATIALANLTQFIGDSLFSLNESCILAGIPNGLFMVVPGGISP